MDFFKTANNQSGNKDTLITFINSYSDFKKEYSSGAWSAKYTQDHSFHFTSAKNTLKK
jgi:hypothetical protein